MFKIKFRRKEGIGFIADIKQKTNEIIIVNNHKDFTVDAYFNQTIDSYKIRLKLLNNIIKAIQYPVRIKLVGSGICSQIRMVEGCIARILLELLSGDKLKQEFKDIIIEHHDLLKVLSKSDLRIVERKKSGYKKARKLKQTNKR